MKGFFCIKMKHAEILSLAFICGFGLFVFSGCLFDKSNTEVSEKVFLDSLPGYPIAEIPADNPLSVKGIELGRMLFYDPILSADSSMSCGTCHNQARAFTDNGRRFSLGIHGDTGNVNASSIISPAWNNFNFWNGRAQSLEQQALGPVVNPIEMASGSWVQVAHKLNSHSSYPKLFKSVFGVSNIDSMLVVQAISQFERTLISNNSKYDRMRRGEASFSDEESRGFFAFMGPTQGDCFHCHVVDMFYDNLFHNNGIDSVIEPESGLGATTKNPLDDGKWKTPTLRNVEYTAPYMHDGRFQTLEEVINHYASGVVLTPTTSPLVAKRLRGEIPPLSEEDKRLIIVFLKTLSDPEFISNPDFSNPFLE